jgi:hypothetical protein
MAGAVEFLPSLSGGFRRLATTTAAAAGLVSIISSNGSLVRTQARVIRYRYAARRMFQNVAKPFSNPVMSVR